MVKGLTFAVCFRSKCSFFSKQPLEPFRPRKARRQNQNSFQKRYRMKVSEKNRRIPGIQVEGGRALSFAVCVLMQLKKLHGLHYRILQFVLESPVCVFYTLFQWSSFDEQLLDRGVAYFCFFQFESNGFDLPIGTIQMFKPGQQHFRALWTVRTVSDKQICYLQSKRARC